MNPITRCGPDESALTLSAPAKINLHLRVGPPAADGFHPLLSWFCSVGLFDTMTFVRSLVPARAGDRFEVQLACDDPSLPCDGTNLIVRVGLALGEALAAARSSGREEEKPAGAAQRQDVGEADEMDPKARRSDGARSAVGCATREGRVSISLQKRIPMGAGLGGGSSNGAFALMGLNRLWAAGWDRDALSALAARFGSDLSFFFHGPSSICTGRGQIVAPTPPPARAKWVLLMLPAMAMPTPAVYRRFDELKLGSHAAVTERPDWAAWSALPVEQLLGQLVNDLEAPAFSIRPELGRIRRELEQRLERVVRMSGSGSSLFTLYEGRSEAESAAARVPAQLEATPVRALAVPLAPRLELSFSEGVG